MIKKLCKEIKIQGHHLRVSFRSAYLLNFQSRYFWKLTEFRMESPSVWLKENSKQKVKSETREKSKNKSCTKYLEFLQVRYM